MFLKVKLSCSLYPTREFIVPNTIYPKDVREETNARFDC